MGQKSGVTLDVGSMCNLAVASQEFASEIGESLDALQRKIEQARNDSTIITGGAPGSTGALLEESLTKLQETSRYIVETVTQIKEISSKQVEQTLQACKANPNLSSAASQAQDAMNRIKSIQAKDQVKSKSGKK